MILNAARGPGNYHGTMRKDELEREAGGAVFNAERGSETHSQVEGTRYQGGTFSIGGGSASSGGGGGASYGKFTIQRPLSSFKPMIAKNIYRLMTIVRDAFRRM